MKKQMEQIHYDIVYVTHNSEKWIEKCFGSYKALDYDLSLINIFIIDNNSSDNTIQKIEETIKSNQIKQRLSTFEVYKLNYNYGFGIANNYGAKKGTSDYVVFINVDTELLRDSFTELSKAINRSDDTFAAWEFRQLPYEHPKLYDINTHETKWCSGAAVCIKRDVFINSNGFDDAFFMYCEDVDLSWRIRSMNYKLQYVPSARIMHYTYLKEGEIKPTQFVNSIINNLLLRLRYGGLKELLYWYCFFINILIKPSINYCIKKDLVIKYFNHFGKIIHMYCDGHYKNTVGQFYGMDYSENRKGAFIENYPMQNEPLVTILCYYPNKKQFDSIINQTYTSIEVIQNKEQHPSGEYVCHLNNDALLYADHVETLMYAIVNSGKKGAYSLDNNNKKAINCAIVENKVNLDIDNMLFVEKTTVYN